MLFTRDCTMPVSFTLMDRPSSLGEASIVAVEPGPLTIRSLARVAPYEMRDTVPIEGRLDALAEQGTPELDVVAATTYIRGPRGSHTRKKVIE